MFQNDVMVFDVVQATVTGREVEVGFQRKIIFEMILLFP